MKNKDLVFYAVSALSLSLFFILPLVGDTTITDNIPGFTLCVEWIKAGEQFVLAGNQALLNELAIVVR